LADDYAKPVYTLLARRGAGDLTLDPPVLVSPTWTDKQTPNHAEGLLAKWAGQNMTSVQSLIVDWYTRGVQLVGLDAKGGTDEGIFSTSHGAHYLWARAAILYFGMRYFNVQVTATMVKIWKQSMAAARLLATPQWILANPGARHLDSSDQRREINATFKWLDTGSLKPVPKTLDTAASWLALKIFRDIEAACKRGEDWAQPWPDVLKEIRSARYPEDLPPLKNVLIVERSAIGHVAEFHTTVRMSAPVMVWAVANYNDRDLFGGPITYGSPGTPAPRCPGGPGKIYRFPIAGGGAK
jgi:hypothetical protein